MDDCLFCKIIAGDIPSAKVYEDESVYAFRDINPQARVHVLIAPKQHLRNITELDKADAGINALSGHILLAANAIAKKEGIADTGFRLVINCGRDGAQSVDHLHVHVLGGEQLSDKMA